MNKIHIQVSMGGVPPREEDFHHFVLLGFDFEGDDNKVALSVVASSSDVGMYVQGILALAKQLQGLDAADAKIIGTAVEKTVMHGLEKLHGLTTSIRAAGDSEGG